MGLVQVERTAIGSGARLYAVVEQRFTWDSSRRRPLEVPRGTPVIEHLDDQLAAVADVLNRWDRSFTSPMAIARTRPCALSFGRPPGSTACRHVLNAMPSSRLVFVPDRTPFSACLRQRPRSAVSARWARCTEPPKYPTVSIAQIGWRCNPDSTAGTRNREARSRCSTTIVHPSAGRFAATPSIGPRSSSYCSDAVCVFAVAASATSG